MSEKKVFKGITMNEGTFLGRVIEDPEFFPSGGDEDYAMLNIATYVREADANGQFVEAEIEIPLLVMDSAKVRVVRDYIQKGRQIKVDTYYKQWTGEDGSPGHAFVVLRISLGDKPYVAPEEKASAGASNLPPR